MLKPVETKPKVKFSASAEGRALLTRHTVKNKKPRESLVPDVDALCKNIGLVGDYDNPILNVNGFQIGDMRRYLIKVRHELHQESVNEHRPAPTADVICKHLGVTDQADVVSEIKKWVSACQSLEAKEAANG